MSLNEKQMRFAQEYIVDLNATQAAIRAGYSQKTAGQMGFELLKKPEIAQFIALEKQKRSERTQITQDRVLEELAKIAFFDIRKLYNDDGSLKAPHMLDDTAAAALAGVDVVEMQGGAELSGNGEIKHIPMYTKKAKLFDKNGALTLAMRHLGMLRDKTELTGPNGEPLAAAAPVLNISLKKE